MSSHDHPVQPADFDTVSAPLSVRVTHGLVYARRDTGELLFDLYRPVVDHPVPGIIWLHGGGWFTGDRTLSPDLSQIAAQSGYAVASIDYRLSGQALFPAQLHDVRAAVRFFRSNAHTYGLDPQAICLWGASAGGHLALLAGLTGPVRQLPGEDEPGETRVAAVAASYPPIDLLDIVDQAAERLPRTDPLSSPEARLIGGHPAQHPRASEYASPLNWITPLAPPIQLSHGLADPLVPYQQSVRMHEALTAAGTASELYLVDEYKHEASIDVNTFVLSERLD